MSCSGSGPSSADRTFGNCLGRGIGLARVFAHFWADSTVRTPGLTALSPQVRPGTDRASNGLRIVGFLLPKLSAHCVLPFVPPTNTVDACIDGRNYWLEQGYAQEQIPAGRSSIELPDMAPIISRRLSVASGGARRDGRMCATERGGAEVSPCTPGAPRD